jgi:hypothetical protein
MTDHDADAERRRFLREAGLLLGGSWLGLQAGPVLAAAEAAHQAHAAGADLTHVDPDSARVFAAVADQIYPPDDTAGAAELGAVAFLDQAVGTFMAPPWPMLRAGLADLDVRARDEFGSGYDALDFATQTELLRRVENEPFFGLAHLLTLLACFTLPSYGGNKDGQGWAQLGFEQRHAWQPPFGDYDDPEFTAAAELPGGFDDGTR